MKRYLLTQIRNEWTDNIWLVLELVVVMLVIWFILLKVYVAVDGLRLPLGVDWTDVYSISVKTVPDNSPGYMQTGEDVTIEGEVGFLLERIRRNPNVEAAGTHSNGLPFNLNYNGTELYKADVVDSVGYPCNVRIMSPDMVKVLRLQSLTGLSQKEMMDALGRDEIILSSNGKYKSWGRDAMALKGAKMIFGSDSSKVFRVADIVPHIRRNDFEKTEGGTLITSSFYPGDPGKIAVRVKPGRGAAFEKDFKNDPALRRQRNVYLTELNSLAKLRELNQKPQTVQLNLYFLLTGFLLITIFLGLLGTFWFRIQQRVGEIALRKVCGARRGDILRRVFSEGLVLLAMAVMVASLCVWPFLKHIKEIMFVYEWIPFIVAEAAAIILMVIGVIVSLWYPAVRAMRIEPALAIKDE